MYSDWGGNIAAAVNTRYGVTQADLIEKYDILKAMYGNRTLGVDDLTKISAAKNWMFFLPKAVVYYLNNPLAASLLDKRPLGFGNSPVRGQVIELYGHFPLSPGVLYVYYRTFPDKGDATTFHKDHKADLDYYLIQRPPHTWPGSSA